MTCLEMSMIASLLTKVFDVTPLDPDFMYMAAQIHAIRKGWAENTLT